MISSATERASFSEQVEAVALDDLAHQLVAEVHGVPPDDRSSWRPHPVRRSLRALSPFLDAPWCCWPASFASERMGRAPWLAKTAK